MLAAGVCCVFLEGFVEGLAEEREIALAAYKEKINVSGIDKSARDWFR